MKSPQKRSGTGSIPRHRMDKLRAQSWTTSTARPIFGAEKTVKNVALNCGWGRLFFAQTYDDAVTLTASLTDEQPGQRDIAFYVSDPHVMLAQAPQYLFLDPSHTFRLHLHAYRPARQLVQGFHVRRLCTEEDAREVNRIYTARNMVSVNPDFFWRNRDSRIFTYFVAEDNETGTILGTITGIDHGRAFNDPECGSSLWCLAVDPQAPHPNIGEALVRRLAEHFSARGAAYLDLSVMHDNDQAIALYEKLGFERIPIFAIKNKNYINEKLFTGPAVETQLNPYAMIIIDEAQRRGIGVEVLDAKAGYFSLSFGGRHIVCRESLSELTTAIAMSRCADKSVTRRILGATGLTVPAQMTAGSNSSNEAFLKRYGRVVVKPVEGEQGRGVFVDIDNPETLSQAILESGYFANSVLIEQYFEGDDLRIIVIDSHLIAAAVRRPPVIVGNGRHTVRELIKKQSRRRQAATNGESSIPLDEETKRCLRIAGYTFDDIPEPDTRISVRKTANLHTGGTIHDVTDILHPTLIDAAVMAAQALNIPVVGLDFIVKSPSKDEYVIIEANERPGLANHEPQPTAEKFIDLLFPQTIVRPPRMLAKESI